MSIWSTPMESGALAGSEILLDMLYVVNSGDANFRKTTSINTN